MISWLVFQLDCGIKSSKCRAEAFRHLGSNMPKLNTIMFNIGLENFIIYLINVVKL